MNHVVPPFVHFLGIEQKVPLKGTKTPPKRALVNYNYDVLASN